MFVCILLKCPNYLLGDHLDYGMCRKISGAAGMPSGKVSKALAKAKFFYFKYQDFAAEADNLTENIKRHLACRNKQYTLFP